MFKRNFYDLNGNILTNRKVLRYVKPHRNIPNEYGKDFVLIQPDKAIDFDNRYTSPICLPPKFNYSFDTGSCIKMGFGNVNEKMVCTIITLLRQSLIFCNLSVFGGNVSNAKFSYRLQ